MTRSTQVAVVQMCATSDIEHNLSSSAPLVQGAADAGAEVVLLPEAFTYIGSNQGKAEALEPLPQGGPILDRCRAMARDANVHLIFGFHEARQKEAREKEAADEGDARSFNTCVHLNPAGEIESCYRKIHMFDVDLSDGTRLLESRGTAPGDTPVTTELPFGTLGLTVCYDVRFPNLYQKLVDMGAVALTVPSAFTRTTGRDHWHVLLRARAIECQAYVFAPAQHGEHGHRNRTSYGHALIVDPWGDIVAEVEEGDGFAIATVEPARIAAVREELPSLKNRRV